MNKKIIISSILTIAICLGVITGATFALFTSTSTTNIAVTAGNIDVTAKIDTESLAAENIGSVDPTYDDNNDVWTFANGGTAKVTEDKVTLTNITPGDAITFKIKVNNDSTVGIKYLVACEIDDSSKFYGELEVYVDGTKVTDSYTSAWTKWDSNTDVEVAVKVILPKEVTGTGEQFDGGIENDIVFKVYAIQGNASDAEANAWLNGLNRS